MLDIVGSDRAYPPEVVMAMTSAFDNVCRSVSAKIHGDAGDADVRRRLALIILRHVDEGERDPARLSELALNELAGIGAPASG